MPKITFGANGPEVTVPGGSELLEVYKKNESLPLKFGCRQGKCGVCAISILEGMQNLTKISPQEIVVLQKKELNPECRHRLACQCALNGDITLQKVF